MNKHGNTFFPGDPVVGSPAGNNKTASARRGKVMDVIDDHGTMRAKVAWDDGTESFEDPETLSKKE